MNRAEAIKTIRFKANKEILAELQSAVEQRRDADHMYPDPPDMDYDLLDAMADIEGTDFVQLVSANKRQFKKLDRLIGVERQVMEGEHIQINNRVLKPGAWVFAKAYHEFE